MEVIGKFKDKPGLILYLRWCQIYSGTVKKYAGYTYVMLKVNVVFDFVNVVFVILAIGWWVGEGGFGGI